MSLTNGEEKKKKVVEFAGSVRTTAAFIFDNPDLKVDGIKYIRNMFGFGLKSYRSLNGALSRKRTMLLTVISVLAACGAVTHSFSKV